MKIEKNEMVGIWESSHQLIESVRGRESYRMLYAPDRKLGISGENGSTEETISAIDQELPEHLKPFHPCFRPEQQKYATAYIKGLLSDLDYKSAEPIALRYGLSVRGMQRFLNTGKWPDQQIWDIYRSRLAEAIACEGGMLTVGRHETPKKGKHSVGVAHQYCTATGKVSNCQSGVYIGYSGERGYGLVGCSLYLPEIWFDEGHNKLREKCGVPETAKFRTKAAMAAEMLQKAHSSGLFPTHWVGLDSFFGNSQEFLSALPAGMCYIADTHPDTLVFREMPTLVTPAYSGRGRRGLKAVPFPAPIAVRDIADLGSLADSSLVDSNTGWTQTHLDKGVQGAVISHEKCLRVIRSENNAPGEEVWLYIHKLGDGSRKYAFCNAPPDTPISVLRRAALMRHPMELCFDECQSCLGLDQYEGRSWNTWHRHNLLVFVAHLFLTCLRHKYENSYHGP